MSLITSKTSTGSGAKALVQVRVDHAALVRGHTEQGEECEIEGVGAVPVSVANAMLSDAVLRVLVTKGQDVVKLSSDTRTLPPGVKGGYRSRQDLRSAIL